MKTLLGRSLLALCCVAEVHAQAPRIAPPPTGKLYHGFYWGGAGTDEHDPTEHDVTPADVALRKRSGGQH